MYVTKLNGDVIITRYIPTSEHFEISELPVPPLPPKGCKAILHADFNKKLIWYEFIKLNPVGDQLDRIEASLTKQRQQIEDEFMLKLIEDGILS